MKQSKFYQIKNITEQEYTLVGCDGSVITRPIRDIDKTATSFTIQDAEDGDVLARNNDILSICIFSHFDGINDKFSSFLCHCGLEGEGLGQELSINGYHDDSKNYIPATKEQRDTLEKAMTNAGYTFDFEKKELKKIEQKPWSEEDKRNLNWVINVWNRLRRGGDAQTTPSQMEYLENFLKSIKGRYTWKPSDEQIEILDMVLTNESMKDNITRILRELREELKKLREE